MSTTNVSITMKFDKDIRGPLRMNPNDFDDPLTSSSTITKFVVLSVVDGFA